MKQAKIEITGWMGTIVHEFKGETWQAVLLEFNDFQDLDCLMRQVYMMGTTADREGFSSFEDFVGKWQSGDVEKADFAACRVQLSIGHLCCLSAADEEGEVAFPAWGMAVGTRLAKTAAETKAKKPRKKPAEKKPTNKSLVNSPKSKSAGKSRSRSRPK